MRGHALAPSMTSRTRSARTSGNRSSFFLPTVVPPALLFQPGPERLCPPADLAGRCRPFQGEVFCEYAVEGGFEFQKPLFVCAVYPPLPIGGHIEKQDA